MTPDQNVQVTQSVTTPCSRWTATWSQDLGDGGVTKEWSSDD
jgi:hypothetical protein